MHPHPALLLALLPWLLPPAPAQTATPPLPVIPGALGFGTAGPLARNRPILRVTTLAAGGRGSLAAALAEADRKGGGVVVFEISGVIDLEAGLKGSVLRVPASNLWIAGQTAPAPGIFIRGGLKMVGRDFLIQHLGIYRPAQTRRESDTLSLVGDKSGGRPGRAILDHLALWGANDGNLDMANYAGRSVTVRYCILAAPLRGGHPKAEGHNFNSLIYGSKGLPARCTWRLNLFSTACDRQPLSSFDELVIVNNLYYNRQPKVGRYIYLRNSYHNNRPSRNTIVGNVFWDTSLTFARLPVLLRPPGRGKGAFLPESRIHLSDNWWNLTTPHVSPDPWRQLVYSSGNPRRPILTATRPTWNRGLVPLPATRVMAAVKAGAGPRPARRIPFLARLCAEAGGPPTHGFPTRLSQIGGELRGLPGRRRPLRLPPEPHRVEADGRTRLEKELFRLARSVERR